MNNTVFKDFEAKSFDFDHIIFNLVLFLLITRRQFAFEHSSEQISKKCYRCTAIYKQISHQNLKKIEITQIFKKCRISNY